MLLKVLHEVSSPTKFKLFSLLWDCKHEDIPFIKMQELFGLSQANLSKQSKELIRLEAILKIKRGREIYFKMNPLFKKDWFDILNPLMNSQEALNYRCICRTGKHLRMSDNG